MTAQLQNSGLARIAAALVGLPWWIGWGTGSGAIASANGLVSAAPETHVAAAVSVGTTNAPNDTFVLVGNITAAVSRAITEFGAFDAATGGNLDIYADAPVINLGAGDSVTYTLRLTFS